MRVRTKTAGATLVFFLAVAAAGAGQPPTAGKAPATGDGQNGPRFDAARFLKDHDRNNDGKLSKDELPEVAQGEFANIDANKDGFITADELQQHAELMAKQRPQLVEVVFYTIDIPEEPVTTGELQKAYDELRKLDKNKDGKIDEGEVKAFRETRAKERIDAIFAVLDKNKDGKLSKDEARGHWADNFAQLDKNGDGVLDRQEVEAACAARGAGNGAAPRK